MSLNYEGKSRDHGQREQGNPTERYEVEAQLEAFPVALEKRSSEKFGQTFGDQSIAAASPSLSLAAGVLDLTCHGGGDTGVFDKMNGHPVSGQFQPIFEVFAD